VRLSEGHGPVLRMAVLAVCLATLAQGDDGTTGNRGLSIRKVLKSAELEQYGFNLASSSGLFVGVSQFDDENFTEVPYAVDDAIDLAYLFVVELELVTAKNVVLALSGIPKKPGSAQRLKQLLALGAETKQPTKSGIIKLVMDQARKAKKDGMFLVSVATHGFSDDGSYLAASDTLRVALKDTGVDSSALFSYISRSEAPRQIVLLDACRERIEVGARATQGGDSAASRILYDALKKTSGQVVLMGATVGGFAYDDDERKNGVFTAAVLDGLRGWAPHDEHGLITVGILADYVDERVRLWVEANKPQHAGLSKGIGRRLEGQVAELPLAVSIEYQEQIKSFRNTVSSNVEKLKECQSPDGPITGAIVDDITRLLRFAEGSPQVIDELAGLCERIDGLNQEKATEESLAFYFGQNRERLFRLMAKDEPAPEIVATPGVRDGMEVVPIPAGTFLMGLTDEQFGEVAPEGKDWREDAMVELPAHRVTLRAFRMDKHEVTNEQYLAFVKATNHRPPKSNGENDRDVWDGMTVPESVARYPVVNVSWGDAMDYCEWVGRRLPTEAEWEYAARGADASTLYPWGGDPVCDQRGRSASYSKCRANITGTVDGYGVESPACSFGEFGYGLCDMAGNAREWVYDVFGEYSGKDATNPNGPKYGSGGRQEIVLRGGSYGHFDHKARVTARDSAGPEGRRSWIGFRCADSAVNASGSPSKGEALAEIEN